MKIGSMKEIREKGLEKEIWVDINSYKSYVIVDGEPLEIAHLSEEDDSFLRFKDVVDRLDVSAYEKKDMWTFYLKEFESRYFQIRRKILAEEIRWLVEDSEDEGMRVVGLRSKMDMVDDAC